MIVLARTPLLPMKRRLLFSTFACLILFNVLLGVRFYTAHAAGTDDDSGYSQISVFARAVQLLRQDYVDGSKTSYHDLGGDYFLTRDNPNHRRRRAIAQLERLGYLVTLDLIEAQPSG